MALSNRKERTKTRISIVSHEALQHLRNFTQGSRAFMDEMEEQASCYHKLVQYAWSERSESTLSRITDPLLFKNALACFGPKLDCEKAPVDLRAIYDITFHKPTGALIIANKGATLFSYSPLSQTPTILRHVGMALVIPSLGIEVVNVGFSGNIYDGKIVLRTESACTPSFIFGSERCNCAHQWVTARELAAIYNPISPPTLDSGEDFEAWVQTQFQYSAGRHIPAEQGLGVLMVHIDTQNGMGSGVSPGVFAGDLYSRASLRHRGEYSAEQVYGTSMAGGFRALGLTPDPRKESSGVGYQVTSIVLDFLEASRDVVLLSNNTLKIDALTDAGYEVKRIKSLGAINLAGAKEARERGSEFNHLDIGHTCVSANDELSRLKFEISKLFEREVS